MFMSLSTIKTCLQLVWPVKAPSIAILPSSSDFLSIWTIACNQEHPPGLTFTSKHLTPALFTSLKMVGSRGIPINILCSSAPGNKACQIASFLCVIFLTSKTGSSLTMSYVSVRSTKGPSECFSSK